MSIGGKRCSDVCRAHLPENSLTEPGTALALA